MTVECPMCEGRKVLSGRGQFRSPDGRRSCRPLAIPCLQCDGAGEITGEAAAWVREGARLAEERTELGMTQREMAAHLTREGPREITVVDVSRAEHGMVDPSTVYPGAA